MPRIAHYVSSTHWDREWYDTFQGYRMKLVRVLDEVIATCAKDPAYKFNMDAQSIAIDDYLEVRPEQRDTVARLVKDGRLIVGPWFCLPDEWLVSGESLIRNIQLGKAIARSYGATSTTPSIIDLFGHISQLPQLFKLFGAKGTTTWRGINERDAFGVSRWQGPDGTQLPVFRFGRRGYCSFWKEARKPAVLTGKTDPDIFVQGLIDYTLYEAQRTQVGPLYLFDGADHMEIEPQISAFIARANEKLAAHDIKIIISTPDAYTAELSAVADKIERTLHGELREAARDPMDEDESWLIPGTLSSRVDIKQKNAACEDALTLWAEPFCTFAATLGAEYPQGLLNIAWRHLLTNHPHDSICGCSIDRVHQDMHYRFDQSHDIATRITTNALKAIATSSAPKDLPATTLVVSVFNHTAQAVDEPVDLDIRLPADWPETFSEFFGFEKKYSFRILGPDGNEIPWQLNAQQHNVPGWRIKRARFPEGDPRHVVSITAPLKIPALGYITLRIEPVKGPKRFPGNMMPTHRTIDNEHLRIAVQSNGAITLHDKRTGRSYPDLVTYEDIADIGDGWYHGIAVNDARHYSTATSATVAVIANGPYKATLRITTTMTLPEEFDFAAMQRSSRLAALTITTDITLRHGASHVEVKTVVNNTVKDHRLRVLLPTQLKADTYFADSPFDVVERPVALLPDNATRRELDVDGRPQHTFTAITDSKLGLATVSRGLYESAVYDTPERPLAITLLRSFRRTVQRGLTETAGQIQGHHEFNWRIVPFSGALPVKALFLHGQRVNTPTQSADLTAFDREAHPTTGTLPLTQSFLHTTGDVVITSLQRHGNSWLIRAFNPHSAAATFTIASAKNLRAVDFDHRPDEAVKVQGATATLKPRQIASLLFES